jgi:hypothetical protein
MAENNDIARRVLPLSHRGQAIGASAAENDRRASNFI